MLPMSLFWWHAGLSWCKVPSTQCRGLVPCFLCPHVRFGQLLEVNLFVVIHGSLLCHCTYVDSHLRCRGCVSLRGCTCAAGPRCESLRGWRGSHTSWVNTSEPGASLASDIYAVRECLAVSRRPRGALVHFNEPCNGQQARG